MRTRTKVISGVAAAVVLLPVALAATFYFRFNTSIAAPKAGAPADAAEADRQDLSYLRETFLANDRSFDTPELRQKFGAALQALQARAGRLTRGELAMGIAQAVALSNNGHTALASSTLRHLPLRFHWFANELRVVQASPDHAALLGHRVDKIGGLPIDEAYARMRPAIPGNEGNKRQRSVHFLGSGDALQGMGVIPSANEVTLEMTSPAGQGVTRIFQLPRSEAPSREIDYRFPHASDCELTCDWPHLLDKRSEPLYAQRAAEACFDAWLDDLGALYVRIFAISDEGKEPVKEFLSKVLAKVEQRKPKNVIVDLRGNNGGNYTLAYSFTKKLKGNVFIITDGGTFSAALVTAAYLKHFTKGHMVGEHAGDFEQFWAEGGGRIVLPNSQLRIWTATGYHDWEHGCSDLSRCFWLNVAIDVPAGKLDPEIPAPSTFAAYAAGRDESLEAIRAWLVAHPG